MVCDFLHTFVNDSTPPRARKIPARSDCRKPITLRHPSPSRKPLPCHSPAASDLGTSWGPSNAGSEETNTDHQGTPAATKNSCPPLQKPLPLHHLSWWSCIYLSEIPPQPPPHPRPRSLHPPPHVCGTNLPPTIWRFDHPWNGLRAPGRWFRGVVLMSLRGIPCFEPQKTRCRLQFLEKKTVNEPRGSLVHDALPTKSKSLKANHYKSTMKFAWFDPFTGWIYFMTAHSLPPSQNVDDWMLQLKPFLLQLFALAVEGPCWNPDPKTALFMAPGAWCVQRRSSTGSQRAFPRQTWARLPSSGGARDLSRSRWGGNSGSCTHI